MVREGEGVRVRALKGSGVFRKRYIRETLYGFLSIFLFI
jgi:hypothetical protein